MSAALTVVMRAWRVPATCIAWGCICAGISLYVIGNLLCFTHVQSQPNPPAPSAADFAWLAVYPCVYISALGLSAVAMGSWSATM